VNVAVAGEDYLDLVRAWRRGYPADGIGAHTSQVVWVGPAVSARAPRTIATAAAQPRAVSALANADDTRQGAS
jgi:hypothetical protein